MFETTACASSLSPPTNQIMACGYNNQIASFASTTPRHQNQNENQSSSLLNLLHFSQEITSTNTNGISSKGDDEYGFLWDMNLEDNSMENGAPSNLDEMRFEIDNSMVFL